MKDICYNISGRSETWQSSSLSQDVAHRSIGRSRVAVRKFDGRELESAGCGVLLVFAHRFRGLNGQVWLLDWRLFRGRTIRIAWRLGLDLCRNPSILDIAVVSCVGRREQVLTATWKGLWLGSVQDMVAAGEETNA